MKAGWGTKPMADICEVFADGDWVESRTALVEHMDGRLELVHWNETPIVQGTNIPVVCSPLIPVLENAHA